LRTPDSDSQLWLAFQEGDEAAYNALYRGHVRAMYRYGASLGSESIVLDCIHDVFTEMWARKERLCVPDNVRFYLLKSLKLRIYHVHQRHRHTASLDEGEAVNHHCTEMSAQELLADREEAQNRNERVGKLISQLPARQQEALRLRFVEEMDYGQIADLLVINRQSAQNLVHRAVEKLRQWAVGVF
jgi:RNA polymerase sigma factor (sigma-70 family)